MASYMALLTECLTVVRRVDVELDSTSGVDPDQAARELGYKDLAVAGNSPWSIDGSEGLDIQWEHGTCDACGYPLTGSGECLRCANAEEPEEEDETAKHMKCIAVEYEIAHQGQHSGGGYFVYLPLEQIDRVPGDDTDEQLKTLFYILTGHDRCRIVHYDLDEVVDQDGNEWEEAWDAKH